MLVTDYFCIISTWFTNFLSIFNTLKVININPTICFNCMFAMFMFFSYYFFATIFILEIFLVFKFLFYFVTTFRLKLIIFIGLRLFLLGLLIFIYLLKLIRFIYLLILLIDVSKYNRFILLRLLSLISLLWYFFFR